MRHVWFALLLVACGKVQSQSVDAAGSADAAFDAAPVAPTVSGISPTRGFATTAVTINGAGFGDTRGTNTVTFGGAAAGITSWSDTKVVVSVPSVLPGDADVVVTTGLGATGPVTFRVILPPMAYVNNDTDDTTGNDTISVMSFDPATGAMTAVGSAVSLGVAASGYGGCSQSIAVHEHTRHLFATGATGVGSFNIDPATGELTPATGSPFAVGMSAFGLIPSADGTKLFVTSYGTKQVAVFAVAADGVLTPITGSPFTPTNDVDTIATAVGDTYVYANTYNSVFQGFHVAATGALTSIGAPFSPGGTAIAKRVGHDQLFVTLQTGAVGVWAVDAGTGTPTQITGSPFTVAVANTIVDTPIFTSDGGRAYFGVYNSGQILGYSVAADGTPTALTGSPFDFSSTVLMSCLAISQDDAWIVGSNESVANVGVFHLDASGVPTQATGSPFASGAPTTGASGLAITF